MEGDFVNQPLVENLLETQLNYWRGRRGVIIDGYPRSADQMKQFEEKVNLRNICETYVKHKRNTNATMSSISVQTKAPHCPPGLFQAAAGTWSLG